MQALAPASQWREPIRKWAFLEPWCAFLRQNAELQGAADDAENLLLCVRMRPAPREPLAVYLERVAQLREALELLTMIAYIDQSAWQELLRSKCRCRKSPFWDDWAMPLGIWLKLGDSKNPKLPYDTVVYRAFFTAFECDDNRVVSETVRVVMQKILSEMTPSMHRELNKHPKVEVCLRFVPSRSLETQHVNRYLQSVVGTAQECMEVVTNADATVGKYVSKLSCTDVELHIGRLEFPSGATKILAEFMALETQTAGFYPLMDFGLHSTLGKLPFQEVQPLLHAIASRVTSPTNNRLGIGDSGRLPLLRNLIAEIGNIAINIVHTPEATLSFARRFQALASALGVSQCFDELLLDSAVGGVTNSARARKWRWLAYALLSKDSTAGITRLTMTEFDFTQEDMDAIISVLNTRNPASKLAPLCRASEDFEQLAGRSIVLQPGDHPFGDLEFEDDEGAGMDDEDPDVRAYYSEDQESNVGESKLPRSVLVQKGTSIGVDPFNTEVDSNQRELFELEEDGVFKVIEDDPENDWVGILVPCYGYCTVLREAIVHVEPSQDADTATSFSWGYRGSVTSVQLALGTEVEVSLFFPILKYLGSTLVSLETTSEVIVDRQSLRQVFEACPHLKILQVIEPRDEIESELIASYAQGRCNIAELRLDYFAPSQATIDLFRELENPASRAAQTLRKLSLFADANFPFDERALQAMLEMLEVNRNLELLRLELQPEHMSTYKQRFIQHHREFIDGVKKPFQVDCRAAFLSVLNSDDEVEGEQASLSRSAKLGTLDRGVISLIFEFAAKRKSRRIRLYEADFEE